MKFLSGVLISLVIGVTLTSCKSDEPVFLYDSSGKNIGIDCSKISDEKDRKACQDSETVRKNTESDAKTLVNALEKGDATSCDKISDTVKSKACIDTIYQQKAIDTGDISFCDKLGDPMRKACPSAVYSHLANKTGDESYCKKMDMQDAQNACISMIRNSPNLSGGASNGETNASISGTGTVLSESGAISVTESGSLTASGSQSGSTSANIPNRPSRGSRVRGE